MSEDVIRIDGVEYDNVRQYKRDEPGNYPIISGPGETVLIVRPKRKQTALRSLCVMDEDGWTQHVVQLPKGWEVAIDGKVVE